MVFLDPISFHSLSSSTNFSASSNQSQARAAGFLIAELTSLSHQIAAKTPSQGFSLFLSEEILAELLREGYDPCYFTDEGDSVLQMAVEKNQWEIVDLALAYGIDPSISNHAGNTALHLAVQKPCHPLISRMLLTKGASVNLLNKKGISPLHYAVAKGDFESTELLLANGADVNALTQPRELPDVRSEERRRQDEEFYNEDHDFFVIDPMPSSYEGPKASPLAIAKRLHPENQELIQLIENSGGVELFEGNQGASLSEYLK